MKRLIISSLLVASVLFVGVARAELGTLSVDALYPNTYGYTLTYLNVIDHQIHTDSNVGAGWMSARWNGAAVSPLFCVDVYSIFSIPDQWEADRTLVNPPQPPAPPANVADISAAYYNYRTSWLNSPTWAEGTQLAIWEISQEADWRIGYQVGTGNWASSGDFMASGGTGFTEATQILDDLYGGNTQSAQTYWYKPTSGHGQGLLGDDVPEPGSLLLLGTALLGTVGLAWRRRK